MKKLLLFLLLAAPCFGQRAVFQPTPATAASDPASCSTSGAWYQKFYYNTTSNVWKYCSAANTWTAFGGAQAAPFTTGTANPAASGVLRCANNETCVAGRDSTNAVDLTFKFDSANLGNFSVGLTAPSYTSSGSNGGLDGTEGTGAGLTAASSHDLLYPQSTAHRWVMNNNNAGAVAVVGTSTTAGTSGDGVKYAANGYDVSDAGAPYGFSTPAVAGWVEEFGSGGTTSGTIGALNWSTVNISGTCVLNTATGATPHFGIFTLATAGTTGNACAMALGSGSLAIGPVNAIANWVEYWTFKISATATVQFRAGMTDSAAAIDPTNGIYIRYDTTLSDTKFTFVTKATSVSASASAVNADTNWHTIKIYSLVAGEISFSLDGGAVTCFTAAASGGCTNATTVVNSANIPSANMGPAEIHATQANSAVTASLDYFAFQATVSR